MDPNGAVEQVEPGEHRATAWLSHGLEKLIAEIRHRRSSSNLEIDFDLVIVGSGYGGAVALSRLAGCQLDGKPLRIALLERGEEYLAGAFPHRFADLPGHVRLSMQGAAPVGARKGLFDVRVGKDLHVLLGNGLGGGSLINAGVMATPLSEVFTDPRWPKDLRESVGDLLARAPVLKQELGAHRYEQKLAKQSVMRGLAGEGLTALDITVANTDHVNAQGVAMKACLACGDCATGCNHQAKASLDLTLLAGTRNKPGVEIYTGATVMCVQEAGADWQLEVVHTNEQKRRREYGPLQLRAGRVILAAGSLGSTEILVRSRSRGLWVSSLLGRQFSANGDAMSTIYDMDHNADAVADEATAPAERGCGPSIVSCIDQRHGNPATDYVIQDISVPAPLRRAFEEISLTANALLALEESDVRTYVGDVEVPDPNAVDADAIRRSLLVATIGHDDADGKLVMKAAADTSDESFLVVEWPKLRSDRRFAERHRMLEERARATGGRVLANPGWRPLSESASQLLNVPMGPPITVHPLGGCSMGEHGDEGVVDHLGRVFAGAGTKVHRGLLVLDGSIVPTSLGINPALSIALLADRAVCGLRNLREENDDKWQLGAPCDQPAQPTTRPIYRPAPTPAPARPTKVVISERLRGKLKLHQNGESKPYLVQMEIISEPVELRSLMAVQGARSIALDSVLSRLRIFPADAPDGVGALQKVDMLFEQPLSGELSLLGHGSSTATRRRLKAGWAWLRNRGLRDVAQAAFEYLAGTPTGSAGGLRLVDRAKMAWALASRAGDARQLRYSLSTEPAADKRSNLLISGAISGIKTLTYGRASNPLNQLLEVQLDQFPQWRRKKRDATLRVDLNYFEKSKSLLLQIDDAQDMPSALQDLGAFAAYLSRTLLHVHLWSFRLPDPPISRTPERLPAALPGLPAREVLEFAVDSTLPDGTPVLARLTRYCSPHARGSTPVLMIHGYSASGTTFAHPAIPEQGLAGYLAKRDYDVWVLDLRSSCGMPTARVQWTFEQVGYSDIPIAIDRVRRVTRVEQVDIVAHCMGSAMLCMALLGEMSPLPGTKDPNPSLRRDLPKRIRRLVLSQVGPRPIMTPANVARAYAMRYLQHYFDLESFQFRADDPNSAAEQALDRLLAIVPYTKNEFRLENPMWPPGKRTPWVRTRHRIDALYGVTFALNNMPKAVLECIDDFFGPLNARTAAQVIHFTRGSQLADTYGRDEFQREEWVRERLQMPILSLHSRRNGLVDFATRNATEKFLAVRPGHESAAIDCGHQDALIGKRAAKVFRKIAVFLRPEDV